MSRPNLARRAAAEGLAAFALVFAGCGAIVADAQYGGALGVVGVALVFGLVIMVMVYATGHLSGAHINPAVTIAFALTRHFPGREAASYIGAQVAGALLAALALLAIWPREPGGLGVTIPSVGIGSALVYEVVMTALLMFVIMAVATDTRAVGAAAAIAIGASVGVDALFGGVVTGASMNPARSLGPAIATGTFTDVWVYIVGPFAGAVLGALAYQGVRTQTPEYRGRMRRLFVLVAAVIMLDTMFYAAITPLLPEFADDLGLSKTAAGVLSASYAAGTLIAALPAGFLAARIGVRPTMLAGLALIAVSSVAFAFADSVVVLDLARFAEGVGGACAWTGALAWLMAAAPAERRGEIIGAALAAAIFGILLGPVIGGIATVTSLEVVFCTVAAVAGGLACWVLATPGIAAAGVPSVRRVAAAIATGPVLFAFWLVVLPAMLSGAFNVLTPLHMDDLGATGLAIGAAFFVAAGLEAFTAPVVGRLSDRRGRMTPIRAGLIATPIAALLLPLPDSALLVAVALIVVVLAMSVIWTPAMALLSDNAEAAGLDLAFASALVSLAWAGGQVIGGSALGGLADATSDAAAYGLIAALFAVTLASVVAVPRLRTA